jgi:hypothetical protein
LSAVRHDLQASNNATNAWTESDKVFILTPSENPPGNSTEIGGFEHLEDWNGAWDFLMERIQKKACEQTLLKSMSILKRAKRKDMDF